MATGYIKLLRKIEQNKPLWTDDALFAGFVRLLIVCNRNNGTYASGLRPLAERFGWSRNKLKMVLRKLECEGSIKVSKGAVTEITLTNFLAYQKGSKIDPQEGPPQTHGEIETGSSSDPPEGSKLTLQGSEIDPDIKEEQEITENLKQETIKPKAEEPAGMENKKSKKELQQEFETWWKLYPKKEAKKKAWDIWQRKRPCLETLLKALEWYVKSDRVADGYILLPTTYLFQERWADDPACYNKNGGKRGTNYDKNEDGGKYDGIGRKL